MGGFLFIFPWIIHSLPALALYPFAVGESGNTTETLTSNAWQDGTLPDHSGFHQAVCLRRRESLISAVALSEFKDGEWLTVDHFRQREDLP